MLARSGLIGCPCPVPVSLTSNLPSSMTPTLIHFPIRRSTLPSIPRFSIIPTHHFDNRLCHAISHGGDGQRELHTNTVSFWGGPRSGILFTHFVAKASQYLR